MQLYHFKHSRLVLLSAFFFCLASTKAKAGLDSYEIYLNQKLILKQYVNQPLKLESLPLTDANANDQLVIYYSQCNTPDKIGKGRRIAVKDAEGNTVKEWKFADASGGHTAMTIPVKEILQLGKSHAGKNLGLSYAAQGRPEGQLLAHFQLRPKATAFVKGMRTTACTKSVMLPISFLQPLCL